jgi:outer membrane lipoprotein SlyB
MNKKLIKKSSLLAFGALTVFVLVGCSNSSNIQTSNQIKQTSTKQEVREETPVTVRGVDLGAGTFTNGSDIEPDTYDLTPNSYDNSNKW